MDLCTCQVSVSKQCLICICCKNPHCNVQTFSTDILVRSLCLSNNDLLICMTAIEALTYYIVVQSSIKDFYLHNIAYVDNDKAISIAAPSLLMPLPKHILDGTDQSTFKTIIKTRLSKTAFNVWLKLCCICFNCFYINFKRICKVLRATKSTF